MKDRFRYFSIVLNVKGGENVDWLSLSKAELIDKMSELKFPTPLDLAKFLKDFEGICQNSNVDKKRIRRFRFLEFKGQLEKGLKSGRPHYNLAVETSSKIKRSALVRELSTSLWGVKNCKSINVEPTHSIDALNEYCLKLETRLILADTPYHPPAVDVRVSDFLEALSEDDELKKFMTIRVCINK